MPSPAIVGGLAAALVLLIVVAVLLSGGPKVPTAAELLLMTPTEIQGIAPKTLAKVPFADLAALGVSQKNALLQPQVAALKDPQVDALILALTPQQCGWLTKTQVEGIEVADVDDILKDGVLALLPWLLPDQKKAITDANVALLGAALVPYLEQLKDTQIQALENSVILGLVDDKLRTVAPKLKQAQIEALDSRQIGVIADLMTETQVGFVDPGKIEALDATKVSAIAGKLSVRQVGFISNSVLTVLANDKLYLIATKLSDAQIMANGGVMEKFADLLTEPKLQLVNPLVIANLTVPKLVSVASMLIEGQIKALTATKIELIAGKLSQAQVGFLDPGVVGGLGVDTLALLASKLNRMNQIQAISADKVNGLIGNLSDTQIAWLEPVQLTKLDIYKFRDVFSKLNNEQVLGSLVIGTQGNNYEDGNWNRIQWFTESQVRLLNASKRGTTPKDVFISLFSFSFLREGANEAKVAWIDDTMFDSAICTYVREDRPDLFDDFVQAAYTTRCQGLGFWS